MYVCVRQRERERERERKRERERERERDMHFNIAIALHGNIHVPGYCMAIPSRAEGTTAADNI